MFWVLSSLILATIVLAKPNPRSQSLGGVYALVQRQAPKHAAFFAFELVDGEGDAYEVSDSPNGIDIQCTTLSACARGFYHYVTEFGNVDIWWTGSRLNELPARLPKMEKVLAGSAVVPWRYHLNACTFDYTMAWWNFEQWEHELDWMALRGVNLPLAWVGYEHILTEVLQDVGLTDASISAFFSGPAFQAWNRLGNVHGSWGGADLPAKWNDGQFALGKRILQRMTELGMTPVLPAFPGFVPDALATLYPDAALVRGSSWENFTSNYTNTMFLEPSDPLFARMQKSFMSKQRTAYGNITHIYTLDQYNENHPDSGELDYLARIAASTFSALRAADPQAVWMLQGWDFFHNEEFWTNDRIEAFLGAVPGNDSMLILDLYSEASPQWQRTASYYGKDWIWCELHDYGGNMGMEGNLPGLVNDPLEALAKSPGMKGMGLAPEGQEGNELVYDILLDQAWSSTSLNVSSYVEKWVRRRYRLDPLPAAALEAWDILASTVYSNSDPDSQATMKSIFELAPSLTGLVDRRGRHGTRVPYDTDTTITPAGLKFILAMRQNPDLPKVTEFTYDFVDVVRQILANRFIEYYETLVASYHDPGTSYADVRYIGERMLLLLQDIERMLALVKDLRLSTWITDARSWATDESGVEDEAYADFLEYNARNQITLWGPSGEVNDYASRQWAGVVGTYYLRRWAHFVNYLVDIKAGKEEYDAEKLAAALLEIGRKWDYEKLEKGDVNVDEVCEGECFIVVVEDLLASWAPATIPDDDDTIASSGQLQKGLSPVWTSLKAYFYLILDLPLTSYFID